MLYTKFMTKEAKRQLRFEMELETRNQPKWMTKTLADADDFYPAMYRVPCEFCGQTVECSARDDIAICEDCDMYFHGRGGYFSDRIGGRDF